MTNRRTICGVGIDSLSRSEFAHQVSSFDRQNRLIVTPNVDFIVRANKNTEFLRVVNTADFSLCDSQIVLTFSRLLGQPIAEKITGSTAAEVLLSQVNSTAGSVFFLGAKDETLRSVESRICEAYPELNFAGSQNGYFSNEDSRKIVDRINAAEVDVLFVGMGSPKQELWCAEHLQHLNASYIVCVGGLFEVMAGNVSRAPQFFQRVGMEWFWRFLHEPRRLFRRYFVEDMYFFWLVAKQLLPGIRNPDAK